MLRYLIITCLSVLFIACAGISHRSDSASLSSQDNALTPDPVRPSWIDNPGNGVSASAGMNAMGRVAQEELAIARARLEYAKRKGVTVVAESVTELKVANERATTSSVGTTTETTQQKEVKAQVKEKWRDELNDVLWVWLVPAD